MKGGSGFSCWECGCREIGEAGGCSHRAWLLSFPEVLLQDWCWCPDGCLGIYGEEACDG